MAFPPVEVCEHVVKTYGAIEGGQQTFGPRADYLANASAMRSGINELHLTRVFGGPRKTVFKVWTDWKELAKWWGPRGFTNPVCEVDIRAGGAIRIHMRGPDGRVYPMTGEYREIIEPERIVFLRGALDAGATRYLKS